MEQSDGQLLTSPESNYSTFGGTDRESPSAASLRQNGDSEPLELSSDDGASGGAFGGANATAGPDPSVDANTTKTNRLFEDGNSLHHLSTDSRMSEDASFVAAAADDANNDDGGRYDDKSNEKTSLVRLKEERAPSRVDNLADKISTNATLFHFMKGFIGNGNLALPYAYAHAGLIPATLLMVFCTVSFTYCVHILIQSSRRLCALTGRRTMDYGYTLQIAFEYGPKKTQFLSKYAKKFVNITIGAMQLAFCMVYLVFIGDNVREVVESSLYIGLPVQVYIALTLPILIMTNLIRNVEALSYISLGGLIIQGAAALIILQYVTGEMLSWDHLMFFETDYKRYPICISTFIFAFEGIAVVLPLENKMAEPEAMTSKFGIVNVGLALLFLFYFAMGFLGYLRYGQESLASITLNLPHDPLYGSLKILLSVVMLATYCVQFMVSHEILFGRIRKWIDNQAAVESWDTCVRILVIVFTVAVAAAIPRLGPFTALVGALFGVMVSITLPAIIDLLHRWPRPDHHGLYKWRIILAIFLIIVGIFFTISGTITAIYDIVVSF